MSRTFILTLASVFALAATPAMAGNAVIPSPDSDTNVQGPTPARPGTCIVNGVVLQDCAPRDWQRAKSTGNGATILRDWRRNARTVLRSYRRTTERTHLHATGSFSRRL